MATVSNLFVDAGSDYSNIITLAASNGQLLNLTGYTVASQMRKSYSSTTAYAFVADIYSALNGQVRLRISAASSSVIPAGRWLYDVEITSSSGATTRVLEGIVTITSQITQS